MKIDINVFNAARGLLQPAYNDYIARISPHNWALSLETGSLFYVICEEVKPAKVIDTGSGFSSYVVRLWQQKNMPSAEVWSVDDSASWLERSKTFCAEKSVGLDNFDVWESFEKAHPEPEFDVVLYDLGSMKMRVNTFPRALKLCKPGGIVIIDDTHKNFYRNEVTRVCGEQNIPLDDMKALTTDSIDRYCWVARIPQT